MDNSKKIFAGKITSKRMAKTVGGIEVNKEEIIDEINGYYSRGFHQDIE